MLAQTENKNKIIAILGGMGPKSSLLLHKLILDLSPKLYNSRKDQDFPSILHLSLSNELPDRTAYILGESDENPAKPAFRHLLSLMTLSECQNQGLIVGIPCNTFFSPKIYDAFTAEISEYPALKIQIPHLIQETTQKIQSQFEAETPVGILSTSGERRLNVYKDQILANNLTPIQTNDDLQNQVQECIFNREWGLKYAHADLDKCANVLTSVIKKQKQQGAKAAILGCTELSLVKDLIQVEDVTVVDSTTVLAERLLKLSQE